MSSPCSKKRQRNKRADEIDRHEPMGAACGHSVTIHKQALKHRRDHAVRESRQQNQAQHQPHRPALRRLRRRGTDAELTFGMSWFV